MPLAEAGARGDEAGLLVRVGQGGQHTLPVRERLLGDIPRSGALAVINNYSLFDLKSGKFGNIRWKNICDRKELVEYVNE